MLSSTKKERRGSLSKTLLSDGIKIPTQTNTILQSCKRRDRVGTRRLKSLRTDVGHWAQKVMGKSDNPRIQRVHRENADYMLLAKFISGLSGNSWRQVRFANPQNMEHALRIPLTVQEAERQERFNESFYTHFKSRYAFAHGPK